LLNFRIANHPLAIAGFVTDLALRERQQSGPMSTREQMLMSSIASAKFATELGGSRSGMHRQQ